MNYNVLSKKRNDMKDEILQIAYSLEKGIIDEETAKQELCVLLGVSNRLSEIKQKSEINAEAWALIHDDEEYQKGVIKGVEYGIDYVISHFK